MQIILHFILTVLLRSLVHAPIAEKLNVEKLSKIAGAPILYILVGLQGQP